jgi:hypothetical protein
MVRKAKILAFSAFLGILILSTFNASMSIAAVPSEGTATEVELKKSNPRQYGVIVPAPNMYVTTRLQGSYQANLDIIQWNEGTPSAPGPDSTINTENIPGYDIAGYGPWYHEGNYFNTPTNDEYIDPWWIRWFNLTALNAQNDTLDNPFYLNTVWNTYTLAEGGSLSIPMNWSIPIQIDVTINSIGPKVIKVDDLSADKDYSQGATYPHPITSQAWTIISPSGDVLTPGVNYFLAYFEREGTSDREYDVLSFVAHETGTYKFLMEPSQAAPLTLYFEFLSPSITNLPTDTLTYFGIGDADPTLRDRYSQQFWSGWVKISATKGDKFRFDYGLDYSETNNQYDSYIWYPCDYGYVVQTVTTTGNTGNPFTSYDLIAPSTGDIYVNIQPRDHDQDIFRFGLYLKKIETQALTLNGTETIHISRDERKAFDFTLEEDTFLRLNMSIFGGGLPVFYGWDGGALAWGAWNISLLTAKKTYCVQGISPLEAKTANYTYLYYYLPKGDYEFLVRNTVPTQDGVLMLTTSYVEWDNNTITPQTLAFDTYLHQPMVNPTAFTPLVFKADDYESGLKKAKWVYVNITKPGQYYVNATVYRVHNPHTLQPYVNPSYIFVMNQTDNSFTDWTAKALDPSPNGFFPAFSTDASDSESGDRLYIAYPQKFHDIELNFTTFASPAETITIYGYEGGGTWSAIGYTDNTQSGGTMRQNGTIDLTFDANYGDWIRGASFDIPGVEERLYYWLAIEATSNYAPVPEINHIRLSNTTLIGDINWAWVRDDTYQYCDFWSMQPTDINDLGVVALMNGYESASNAAPISFWTYQGIESDAVKFLIVPEKWSYPGDIVVAISVYCYNAFELGAFYNITANPIINPWQIQSNVNAPKGSVLFNYTTYPAFSINHKFNSTRYINPQTSVVRYIINCTGSYLNWTQLICAIQNVTSYDLYLVQDLPWISNANPNNEIMLIDNNGGTNATYEFGVLNSNFYLIFDITPSAELVTLKVCLTQYNTTRVYTVAPVVPVVPIVPGYPLLITLGVSVTAVVVIAYVMNKKKALSRGDKK